MDTGPQIPELHFHTPSKDFEQESILNESSGDNHNNDQSALQQLNENILIKNYMLGETIGQGTFNKVKIARHILTDEKVAIKIIDKSSIQNEADKKRLDIELKILRKVRHPNIAQLFEIFQNKNHLFLVTQHVSRGELFDHILQSSKLTEFEACKFLQQLLDAVEYIHSLGVAHRDLKPENILLDNRFNIKLIDFGLSNIYSRNELLHTACGSPCYAAPEMLNGKPYDGLKADIWSVGVILYAMCFGYLPFDSPNTKELYQSIRQGRYDMPDHASRQLRSILSLILEVDPDERANIDQIRRHPFCKFSPLRLTPGIIVGLSDIPYEQQIQKQIVEGIHGGKHLDQQQKQQLKNKLKHSIKFNKHNELSATYYLILQKVLKSNNETLVNYYVKRNNQINRYSIAQKVKEFYDKRLHEKIMNQTKNHSPQKVSTKTHSKSSKNNQKNQFAKTHKKQAFNVVELYDNSKQKQQLQKERRLKTTNTKRRKDFKENENDKVFKKTRLNFNQIQLQQFRNHKNTPQKVKDKSFDKNKMDRIRNKSFSNITSKFNNQKVPRSPQKKFQKSPNRKVQKSLEKKIFKSPEEGTNIKFTKDFSSKKKRSKSQNTFYTKTIKDTNQKKMQRKENLKNHQDKIKEKSPTKSSQKKLKVKINSQMFP